MKDCFPGALLGGPRTYHGSTMPAMNDRSIPVRCVPCPTCGVGVGETCVSSTGKPGHHVPRRRMALRKLNAAETDTRPPVRTVSARYYTTVTVQARRAHRGSATRDELAEQLGLPPHAVHRAETGRPLSLAFAAVYSAWLWEQTHVVA